MFCGYDGWAVASIPEEKKRLHWVTQCKQISMNRQGSHIINASHKLTFQKFRTSLTLLYSSHNYSTCLLRFIYLPNNMQWRAWRAMTPHILCQRVHSFTRRPHFQNYNCLQFFVQPCTFLIKKVALKKVFFVILNFVSFRNFETNRKANADDTNILIP